MDTYDWGTSVGRLVAAMLSGMRAKRALLYLFVATQILPPFRGRRCKMIGGSGVDVAMIAFNGSTLGSGTFRMYIFKRLIY